MNKQSNSPPPIGLVAIVSGTVLGFVVRRLRMHRLSRPKLVPAIGLGRSRLIESR